MPFELLQYDMLLPAFALVLSRVAGLVLSVPMISSRQIPREFKIGLIVLLSLMAFPVVSQHLPRTLTFGHAVVGMLGEFVIGEVLGFGAGIVFFAAQIAGKILSHQSGMALGTVFNPIFDAEATVLDQIWFFTTLMIFLGLGGHVAVVTVLLNSFQTVPPMRAVIDLGLADFLIDVLQSMFELAIRLGGPAILALLLGSLVMGFLTKTIPQLNILSIGFSMKVAIALFMMALTLSVSGEVIGDALFDGLDRVGIVFAQMSESLIDGG